MREREASTNPDGRGTARISLAVLRARIASGAQLAEQIQSPAVGIAGRSECARMIAGGAERTERQSASHAHWCGAARGVLTAVFRSGIVSNPEISPRIWTPTISPAAGRERARVFDHLERLSACDGDGNRAARLSSERRWTMLRAVVIADAKFSDSI